MLICDLRRCKVIENKPKKTEDGLTIIYDANDIPTFKSELEEACFWETHTWSEEFWDGVLKDSDEFLDLSCKKTQPNRITLYLEKDTLERLKVLAVHKHTACEVLIENFVQERLYEEEKREGLITSHN